MNSDMISQADAVKKFQEVIPRVDPHLVLDVGDVRFVSEPYPGVEFGLRLGDAGALLFVSEVPGGVPPRPQGRGAGHVIDGRRDPRPARLSMLGESSLRS